MKFDVTIRGVAPLLMHRFSESMITGTKKVKGDKVLTDKERKEVAEQFLYKQGTKLVQPALHLEMALAGASSELRLAGAGKKTYKQLVKSSVFVYPEQIVHKHQEWTVDSRPVVNQSTGGRVMSYRPRLDKWELDFQLEVFDDRADKDAIKEILTIAGLRSGLGAFRPRFGRFEVVKFKELADK